MNKVFKRTENGETKIISLREGLAEINHAMMEGKKDVREMFEGSTGARITYKDGRRVTLLKVDAPAEGPQTVTVKGKRYIVSEITPARPRTEGAKSWIPEAYVSYWSERNGERFGATRFASASAKPGTVARAIWDAISR